MARNLIPRLVGAVIAISTGIVLAGPATASVAQPTAPTSVSTGRPACTYLTHGEKAALVIAATGVRLVEHSSSHRSPTATTSTCVWWPQGHHTQYGYLSLERGSAALKRYQILESRVDAGVYHALAHGPAGSGWFYHTGLSGFEYVNGVLVQVVGDGNLRPRQLLQPLWDIYNQLAPAACSYLDAAHMAELVNAPQGTDRQVLHPQSTAYSSFLGFFRDCQWTYGSRHGYLRLEVGPQAATDQSGLSLKYGPPGSTIVDYLLPSGWTAEYFAHGVLAMVAGPLVPLGHNPTDAQLKTLAAAVWQIHCRLP